MKTILLTKDADELIARAKAIATVLVEKRDEPGLSTDVEALLRASIEATTYAVNGYVALVAAAKKSGIPMGYLAHLSRLMDEREARKAAKYISIST
jgi:hypothetical protein